jgi:hypothetical protein
MLYVRDDDKVDFIVDTMLGEGEVVLEIYGHNQHLNLR